MSKPWMFVLFAVIDEVIWVFGLKYSETAFQWILTIFFILFSFYFVIKACEKLPSGTVYATFTGAGAAAIALVDFYLFNSDISALESLFIFFIIIGVIGLKLTTDGESKGNSSSHVKGET